MDLREQICQVLRGNCQINYLYPENDTRRYWMGNHLTDDVLKKLLEIPELKEALSLLAHKDEINELLELLKQGKLVKLADDQMYGERMICQTCDYKRTPECNDCSEYVAFSTAVGQLSLSGFKKVETL